MTAGDADVPVETGVNEVVLLIAAVYAIAAVLCGDFGTALLAILALVCVRYKKIISLTMFRVMHPM